MENYIINKNHNNAQVESVQLRKSLEKDFSFLPRDRVGYIEKLYICLTQLKVNAQLAKIAGSLYIHYVHTW